MIKSLLAHFDDHMWEVVRGASFVLFINILGTVLGFAVSVVIARKLGAEGSGIYYLATSVATIVATLGRVGFENTVVRFVASHGSVREWSKIRGIMHRVVLLVGSVSLILAAGLGLSASWFANVLFEKPVMEFPIVLAAIAVVPMSLATIYGEALRGLKRISSSQWVKSAFVSCITMLLLVPFVYLWKTNGALLSYVVANLCAAILGWMLWSRSFRMDRGSDFDDNAMYVPLKPLLQSSLPLFGLILTGLAIQQAATLFLGVLGSSEDVGVFNVANRVASLLLFPLMALISILAPKLSILYQQNAHLDFARLARHSTLLLCLTTLPVLALVYIEAGRIIEIFGPEFISGESAIKVLLLGIGVNVVTGAVGNVLMMAGFEKTVWKVSAVSTFITLALLAILTPSYGILGAAASIALGMAMQNLMMLVMVKQHLGFWMIGWSINRSTT